MQGRLDKIAAITALVIVLTFVLIRVHGRRRS
jgi:hypothetical protein